MDLSVIVVSWNTKDLLQGCLDSIRDTVSAIEHEVIVVDNGSTDGSRELVSSEYPEVLLIANDRNLGFAGANNQAIGVSRGRLVLLLNSDAVLLPGAASQLVDFLDSHSGSAVAGAQLLNPDGTFQWSYANFPTLVGELLLATKLAKLVHGATFPSYSEEDSQQERAVDWVMGACMLVRRSAIERVGMLDEDYFMYTEETDWCYRMVQAGWTVDYVPAAKVVHWGGKSAGRAPERRRSQIYLSKLRFFRKHRGPLTARAFRHAIQLASAAKLLVWAAASLTRERSRHERARQQVRSYARLLSEL